MQFEIPINILSKIYTEPSRFQAGQMKLNLVLVAIIIIITSGEFLKPGTESPY